MHGRGTEWWWRGTESHVMSYVDSKGFMCLLWVGDCLGQ